MSEFNPYGDPSQGGEERNESVEVESSMDTNKTAFESIAANLRSISSELKSVLNNDEPQVNKEETVQLCKELSGLFGQAAGLLWIGIEMDSAGILTRPAIELNNHQIEEELEEVEVSSVKNGKRAESRPPINPVINLVPVVKKKPAVKKSTPAIEISSAKRDISDDEYEEEGVESAGDVKPVKKKAKNNPTPFKENVCAGLIRLLKGRNGQSITSSDAFAQLKQQPEYSDSVSTRTVGALLNRRTHIFLSDGKKVPQFTLVEESNILQSSPSKMSGPKPKSKNKLTLKKPKLEAGDTENPLRFIPLPPIPGTGFASPPISFNEPASRGFGDLDQDEFSSLPSASGSRSYPTPSSVDHSQLNSGYRNQNFAHSLGPKPSNRIDMSASHSDSTQSTIANLFNSRPDHLRFDLPPLPAREESPTPFTQSPLEKKGNCTTGTFDSNFHSASTIESNFSSTAQLSRSSPVTKKGFKALLPKAPVESRAEIGSIGFDRFSSSDKDNATDRADSSVGDFEVLVDDDGYMK